MPGPRRVRGETSRRRLDAAAAPAPELVVFPTRPNPLPLLSARFRDSAAFDIISDMVSLRYGAAAGYSAHSALLC